MVKRILTIGVLVVGVASLGCAQRYTVPASTLMRGDTVKDVYVRTADGYEYHFETVAVQGDDLVGTLKEEVEMVGEGGDVFVATEVRTLNIPISTVLEVEGVRRGLSSNTLYIAGALGAGAIVYAAATSNDVSDGRQQSTGLAHKPDQ